MHSHGHMAVTHIEPCARYRAELYDLNNDPEESHNIAEDEVNQPKMTSLT